MVGMRSNSQYNKPMNFHDLQLLHLVRRAEQAVGQKPEHETQRASPSVSQDVALAEVLVSNIEPIEMELRESSQPFATKARLRATQLAQVSGLGKRYWQFVQRTKKLALALFMLMAVLGFMTALQTVSAEGNQLNIYWLLLLLLGVNAVSMLFWLLFVVHAAITNRLTKASSRHQANRYNIQRDAFLHEIANDRLSLVLTLFHWVVAKVSRGINGSFLFSNWVGSHLVGRVGQWTNSQLLHSAWLSYLLGGLLALLLTFSSKQYDFVWGSTILPDTVFVSATEQLGFLPSKLGFAVPNEQQILAAQTAATITNITTTAAVIAQEQPVSEHAAAELRTYWASFLLGCIVVYGLLPRLLCWLLSGLMLLLAKRRCAVDWEQAYFFQMRMRLQAESAVLGVVDEDDNPADQRKPTIADKESIARNMLTLSDLQIKQDTWVAAFEWGDDVLPKLPIQVEQFVGLINDSTAQQTLLQQIKSSSSPSLCLLVALERVADRGATRFLQQLNQHCDLSILIVRRVATESDLARWSAWKMVAERIVLPIDQLQLLSLTTVPKWGAA